MTDLTELPNVGKKLADELRSAGIATPKKLITLGSVEAAIRIAKGRPHSGYNLLYALEGAIRGVRWHSLRREDLIRLRTEYDRRQSKS